ncbi:MAG: hypothetical protein AAFN81_29005 [Bacteroidota bacterium]
MEKNKILIWLVFICLCSCENEDFKKAKSFTFRTSTKVDSISIDDYPKGIPIYKSMFYDSIKSYVDNGKLRESLSYHHLLKIGKYTEVKQANELELDWGLNQVDNKELKKIDDYELVDAQEFILDKSKDHEIIIISEAHTKPEHRVFTRCLLNGLYTNGYRHLGLENILALSRDKSGKMMDSLMNIRGYPTITALSGIYTSEPEYSNLIREAIDIGFTIFSYERNGSSDSERDKQQAERIINYMSNIPDGDKVICHAGWYHAIEGSIKKSEESENYWLAHEYKRLSGIDPLTIYQDALNYKIATNQKSSPYYDYLQDRIKGYVKPLVLIDENNKPWPGPGDSLPFDIVTVQPRINYDYNDNSLPWDSWNCSSCESKKVEIDLFNLNSEISSDEIYLFEVRRAYESELATPLYGKEISINNPILNLNLCIGSYKVKFIDRDGNEYKALISL